MHRDARLFVRSVAANVKPGAAVVEIGSRNINGSVRPYFRHAGLYLGVDNQVGPEVDIEADGATWDGDGRQYDCVVCCEVLEHAADPRAMCANIARLTAPGGLVILTAASPKRAPHSAVDGGPLRDGEQYQGVTEDDLREWFGVGVTLSIYPSPVEDIYAVVGVA